MKFTSADWHDWQLRLPGSDLLFSIRRSELKQMPIQAQPGGRVIWFLHGSSFSCTTVWFLKFFIKVTDCNFTCSFFYMMTHKADVSVFGVMSKHKDTDLKTLFFLNEVSLQLLFTKKEIASRPSDANLITTHTHLDTCGCTSVLVWTWLTSLVCQSALSDADGNFSFSNNQNIWSYLHLYSKQSHLGFLTRRDLMKSTARAEIPSKVSCE